MRSLILFSSLAIGLSSMAQQSSNPEKLKHLKVGDICPNIEFASTINYPKSKARLSDFNGKAKIIDFWATWCVPCIRNIPKMDTLQRKLGSRLQIILVNDEAKGKAQDFFKKAPKLQLFTASINEMHPILKLFPHIYLPHYVWLDSNNKVYAITGEYEVAEKNILSFLDGKPSTFATKNDSLINDNAVDKMPAPLDPEHNILFKSVLTGFDSSKQQSLEVYRTPGSYFENRRIRATNFSIGHLYLVAYGNYGNSGGQFPRELVYYNVKDPFQMNYPRDVDPATRSKWLSRNTYNYELITPESLKNDFYKIMREDLDRVFGLRSGLNERVTKCLILSYNGRDSLQSHSDSSVYDMNIYWFKMKNQPVSRLIDVIRRFNINANLPIVDETGISYKIDLDIHCNLKDISALKKELTKYGLTLEEEERMLTMLVISDH